MPSHHRVCFRRAATVGGGWTGRPPTGECCWGWISQAPDALSRMMWWQATCVQQPQKTHHASKGGGV
jgi:hypothetical protein